jgi:hypothetical protein
MVTVQLIARFNMVINQCWAAAGVHKIIPVVVVARNDCYRDQYLINRCPPPPLLASCIIFNQSFERACFRVAAVCC